MKCTVTTYSFEQARRDGRVKDATELPALAKSCGFEGVEFAAMPWQTLSARAKELRAACDDAGIAATSICMGADFLQNGLEAEINQLKACAEAAAILGAGVMRHDASAGFPKDHQGARDFAAALPALAEGCRRVTEFAAGLGVRTCVENHGRFCQDSARVEALVNAVAHPNFGVLVDMGNFLCVDEDPTKAVGLLAPYAVHAHAKDFFCKPGTSAYPGTGWFGTRAGNWLRGTVVGHGDVPVMQCLRLLRDAGYDGWLSVEFEGIEDCVRGVTWGRENLERMLAQLD